MGFWGTAVLVRWPGDVTDVPAVGALSQGVRHSGRFGDWVLGWFDEPGMFRLPDWFDRIVSDTGTGCLVAGFLDSSFAFVVARAADGAEASAFVGREQVPVDDVDRYAWARSFPPAVEAAGELAGWARACGLTPDEAGLVDALSAAPDPFAEDVFDRVLLTLGLDRDAAPTVQPPARRRKVTPRNPVDLLVRDVVAPVAERAGFVRSGRGFRYVVPNGSAAYLGIARAPWLGDGVERFVVHEGFATGAALAARDEMYAARGDSRAQGRRLDESLVSGSTLAALPPQAHFSGVGEPRSHPVWGVRTDDDENLRGELGRSISAAAEQLVRFVGDPVAAADLLMDADHWDDWVISCTTPDRPWLRAWAFVTTGRYDEALRVAAENDLRLGGDPDGVARFVDRWKAQGERRLPGEWQKDLR